MTRRIAPNKPYLAHGLWLVVLAKCVTPPLWSSPVGVFSLVQPEVHVADSNESSQPHAAHPQSMQQIPAADRQPEESAQFERSFTRDAGSLQSSDVKSDASRATESAPSDSETEYTEPSGSHDVEHGVSAPRFTNVGRGLIVVWITGALLLVAASAGRWCICLRRVRRMRERPSADLLNLIDDLSRRMNLRRRVRVVVTRSRIGPAVVGVLRPTIVLPAAIVAGKSPRELEPLIAHELIHVRRGDLWVGVWQVAAQAVWWFHPLVWLANRMAVRDAERCCDEEALRSLNLDPARYARALADVLELKHKLKPVPVFPGVRPVEVTSKRLERIMKLGQESSSNKPWRRRVLMLVAAAVALPGAALSVVGNEEPDLTSPIEAETPWKEPPRKESRQEAKSAPKLSTRVYKVSDLLKSCRERYGINREQAQEVLFNCAAMHRPKSPPQPLGSVVQKIGYVGPRISSRLPAFSPDEAPFRKWDNNRLIVRQTDENHEQLGRYLAHRRKYGWEHVTVETTFVSAPKSAIAEVHIDWRTMPVDEPETLSIFDDFGAVPHDGSPIRQKGTREFVEKTRLCRFAVLKPRDAVWTIEQLRNDQRVKLNDRMTRWSIVNGASAAVWDAVQRPFIVGYRADNDGGLTPQLRVITDGLQVRTRPLLKEDGRIQLAIRLAHTRVNGVEVVDYPASDASGGGEPKKVQIPEIGIKEIEGPFDLRPGDTLVVDASLPAGDDSTTRSTLVFLKVSKTPRNDAVYIRIKERITISMQNETLGDVLRRIAEKGHFNLLVDNLALRRVETDVNVRVTLQVEDVPIKTALKQLLNPQKLRFVAEDDVLRVVDQRPPRNAAPPTAEDLKE